MLSKISEFICGNIHNMMIFLGTAAVAHSHISFEEHNKKFTIKITWSIIALRGCIWMFVKG